MITSSRRPATKMQKVISYLATGKTLTAPEARSRFGVANLRATISDIREVEAFGNWQVIRETSPTGKTRYTMKDMYKGKRKMGFRKDGTRFTIR
jgi:3-phenylpropionate/cinnamic acid dioxygenase small subunit